MLLLAMVVAAFATLAVAHLVFYKLHWIVRYASITKWMTLSIFPFRVVLLSTTISCLIFSTTLTSCNSTRGAPIHTHTHILFYWTHTEQVFLSNFSPIYRTSLLFWLLISVSKSLWVSVCVCACMWICIRIKRHSAAKGGENVEENEERGKLKRDKKSFGFLHFMPCSSSSSFIHVIIWIYRFR